MSDAWRLPWALVVAAISQAAAASDWTIAREGMSDVTGAAFGGSSYVVVTGNFQPGEIWSSPDTIRWTRSPNPDPKSRPLSAVAFGGGRFVAVGSGHQANYTETAFLTSLDGQAWTFCGAVHPTELTSVAWGDGRFVAVGWSGAVFTSDDGCAWTPAPPPVAGPLIDVVYGAGEFMAMTQVGDTTKLIASSDGTSWSPRGSIFYGGFTSLSYSAGAYVAAGWRGIARSLDGSVWKRVRAGRFADVAPRGSGFVAVGLKRIETSPDGLHWTPAQLEIPSGVLADLMTVTSGPRDSLAAGGTGTLLSTPAGTLEAWHDRSLEGSRELQGVGTSPSSECAVGDHAAIAASEDGMAWFNAAAPKRDIYMRSVAFGQGLHVAVMQWPSLALTSPDCVHWTERVLPKDHGLYSVAHGPDGFVAVGLWWKDPELPIPAILKSIDGIEWNPVPTSLPDNYGSLACVAWGGGEWVAIGFQGTSSDPTSPQHVAILTSTDGVTWTSHPAGAAFNPGGYPQKIAWHDGVFVAVNGALWTSVDGVTWVQGPNEWFVQSVAAGDDGFAAVGRVGFDDTVILRSPDGMSWMPDHSPTSKTLNDVVFSTSLGRYVAVGESVILVSP